MQSRALVEAEEHALEVRSPWDFEGRRICVPFLLVGDCAAVLIILRSSNIMLGVIRVPGSAGGALDRRVDLLTPTLFVQRRA